jgi:hypothetical protein
MHSPRRQEGRFIVGLLSGLCLGVALLSLPLLLLDPALFSLTRLMPLLDEGWVLLQDNLRGSLLPFMTLLLAFLLLLYRSGQLLSRPGVELDRVVRHEQLLDLCASLFFGVGVIWTAVGMREALLYGLGDPGAAAQTGAFNILQRLVDGGILLALSTTIVGGVGGYLMRMVKSLALGQELAALYLRESQRPGEDNLAALQRIENLLQHPVARPRGDGA